MAAASSRPARQRLLLLLIAAVLAARGAVSGGEESAVLLSLRELECGRSNGAAAAVAARESSSRHAGANKGEQKNVDVARDATTVLELRHHSLVSISDHPAARESYLRRLLVADEARANSLQRRSKAETTHSESGQAAAEVPLVSGIRFQTLNYVTTIGLGRRSSGGAATNLTVIVDTGSDLTWVQCKPCADCYAQRDPLFDPAASATYAAVPCNASACAGSLKAATGTPGSCSRGGDRCYYALAYGDGSFSRGVLATDTVGLGGASLDGFVFGCGLSNRGLFGGTAGLMGLGRTELSLVSQTASRFGGVFSYCLPASMSAGAVGSLSLGGGGGSSSYRNTTPVAYTRMIADPVQPPFYFMNVTGAAVGGAAVAAAGLGASNVLIDSGTVITRLPPSVYRAVRAEFARQFGAGGGGRYPAAPAFSILDTCYNLAGYDEVKVPLLTLRLEGGADMTVDAAGMLFMVRKDGSQVCLAMASLSFEDQTPIIGNYQQKNKRMVYDTVGSRIGFANEDCSYT